MNQKRLIEIAQSLFEKRANARCFHVGIVLDKSKILSIAVNQYKTHPKTKEYNYNDFSGIHAEFASCLKLGMVDCSGLTIVSLRVNNNKMIDNALFCKGCQHLIKILNFKNAFYSNSDGQIVPFSI